MIVCFILPLTVVKNANLSSRSDFSELIVVWRIRRCNYYFIYHY